MALPDTVSSGGTSHLAHHGELHSILNGDAKSAGVLQLGHATKSVLAFPNAAALGDYLSPNSATAGPAIYSWAAHKLGIRTWHLQIGPWMDSPMNFEASGIYSCTLLLQRDTSNNDNSINFGTSRVAGGPGTPNPKTHFVFEQAGNDDLVIKHVQGTPGLPYNATYTETFHIVQEWRYPASTTAWASVGLVHSNLAMSNGEGWAASQFGGGTGVVYLDNAGTVPTTNPSAGGILYASGGTLFWRSSAGNVRTVAAV